MEELDMVIYDNFNDQRVATRTGSTLRFLLGDHLGSTAITTNSSGALGSETRYYPWGEKRYYYGSFPTIPRASGQDYQFTSGPMKTSSIESWTGLQAGNV